MASPVVKQAITPPFGGGVEGSTPSRRALPRPCRHCGGPTWREDEEGAVHPCCELWRNKGKTDAEGLLICPACRESERLNREQRNRRTVVRQPAGPEQVNRLPYDVGDCRTCHRKSIRFFAEGQCYYCVWRLRKELPDDKVHSEGESPLLIE